MTELNFSAIGDSSEDIEEVARLLEEFQKVTGIAVNVSRLAWDKAWQTLLMTAVEGKSGDIAQVGSTWAPTLGAFDSLRPFNEAEIRSLGGSLAFVPAAWQTVRVNGMGKVWAIPWSVYTFVVFYRRDLLKAAGVEEESAFQTTEAMQATFERLQVAGIIPWAIPTRTNYLDLPHIASSWVRAYGGDFISANGKLVTFNTPHARQGLVEFFSLYRFIPAHLQELDYETCLSEFFEKGSTAVLIAGAEAYNDASATLSPEVRGQVGVATVPGVPWIGGDHLVVWKTVRADLRKEQAALDLICSMTSTENQARLQREASILPARLDAYADLEFEPADLKIVLEKALQTARPHPPLHLWRRMESMLLDMLVETAHAVVNSPGQSVAEIVEAKLAAHEKRLSVVLDG